MTEEILSPRGRRARSGLHDGIGRPGSAAVGSEMSDELIAELRRRLLDGETHYPVRPGMTELRTRVAELLAEAGLPERGPNSVVITASEGEALFAALIALGAWESRSVSGSVPSEHAALLHWMGVSADEPGATPEDFDRFRAGDGIETVIVGDALLSNPSSLAAVTHADLVIGSLSGVEGAGSFGLGYAAGDPALVAQVTKWKQASSICSPGPSQRALLWSVGGGA